jgi:dihydroorotase
LSGVLRPTITRVLAQSGCAGCFSAHAGLELYAEALESVGALDKLEAFAAHNGADFYGLPRNPGTVTLARAPWTVPDAYPFAGGEVVPLKAGQTIAWALVRQRGAEA